MLQVMGFLRDVRKRTEGTDRLFEPLRHIVSLLSKHGVSTPSEIVAGLEQVPVLWANVKKKALSTKEKHSKEQNAQAEKVPCHFLCVLLLRESLLYFRDPFLTAVLHPMLPSVGEASE